MRFSEWLRKIEYIGDVEIFSINNILVEVFEFSSPEKLKKFRVAWTDERGRMIVRYVIAKNKTEAFNMVKYDLTNQNLKPIIGHQGRTSIKDVQPVDNIQEVLKMVKLLIKRNNLSTIDAYDVNIMLKALLAGILSPEDKNLIIGVIQRLKKSDNTLVDKLLKKGPASSALFGGQNWELLMRLKNA